MFKHLADARHHQYRAAPAFTELYEQCVRQAGGPHGLGALHERKTPLKTMTLQSLRAIGFLAFGVCAAKSAMAALAANVSISIKQLGVYGRVNVGQPLPQIGWVNLQPAIVTQPPRAWQRQPIYL